MQEVLTAWDVSLEQEERELEAISRFGTAAGIFEQMFRAAQQGFPGLQLATPNDSSRPVRRRRRGKGRKSDIVSDLQREPG